MKASSDVFISYSTDGKPWAKRLSDSLESKGISTWTDFNNIKPGKRWLEEIERALDDARYFLIVVGPKNQVGEWQDREWQGALQRTWTNPKKRFIPVLIDDATPPPFLKNWGSVRMQSGKSEAGAIDEIYKALRGSNSRGVQALAKQNVKPNRELQTRLRELEIAAKRIKSHQEM